MISTLTSNYGSIGLDLSTSKVLMMESLGKFLRYLVEENTMKLHMA